MSFSSRTRLFRHFQLRSPKIRLQVQSLELRCVPATINGQVFYDVNGNGAIDAGDTGISGVTVFLDSNNNGVIDNGPTKTYSSTAVPVAISATGTPTVTSTLTIADVGQIADINVKLNITHTFDSDLVVSLKSPAGTSVTLFSAVGSTGDNFTNTVLDDEAATSITAGTAPFSGSFKPSPGLLSSFDGQMTNGTWTLTIQDTANQDGGSLNSWSVDIVSAGETSTVTNASGNYSFSGLAAGSYNVAHVIPAGNTQTAPGGDGRHHVTLADPDTFVGNFGDRLPPATISGLVFNDTSGNGIQDVGELPVPGVTVYLDIDKSGTFNAGDVSVVTDSGGVYTFTDLVPNKEYTVAEVLPGGFTHIAPIRNGLTPSTNINTTKRTGDQTETTIAIDPSNPNRVFMASNELSVTGMAAAYSTNGGTSWNLRTFATGGDITAANGDPSAAFDMFGNLWLTYLSASGINTLVARSVDGGATFTNFATVGTGNDQCSITTGPSNTAGRALVAVMFNDNGGENVSYLDVSAAGPIGTFTTAVLVPSSNSGITGNFGDITIGPNGKVAVAYVNSGSGATGTDNVFFNLDPDGIGPLGFGARTTATATNVSAFDVVPAQPSRSFDAEPDLEWDSSGGPNNGRLYLLYTDELVNESNNTEIYLRYSDNNGTSWTAPVRVNDDVGTRSQFLPRMDIDQTTGYLAFSWYDARNDASNIQAEYWATTSFDGGKTFQPNIKISGGKSNATGGSSFDYGDYSDISYTNGRFIAAWGDNSNSTGDNPNGTGAMDVYIAKVTVANNVPNFLISTMPGTTYANQNFAIKGSNPPPTVTIDQAVGQSDPTNGSTINYTVVFSAPVSDFATGDVTLGGTAGATTAIVTGSGITYDVAISGMTTNGTVIATIGAGVATSGGTPNVASTSTDNSVTYDISAPTASSVPADVTSAVSTYTFTVLLADNVAISFASIDNNDVRVIGPNSYDVPATLVSVDTPGDGSPRTATYSIVPPGGQWDFTDNGNYSVVMQNNQVSDAAGNSVAGGTLDTFDVNVAPVTVTEFKINDGSAQRSMVTSLTITFSDPVSLPAIPEEAFALSNLLTLLPVTLHAVAVGNVVTLDFVGGSVNNLSLADGRYSFTIFKSKVNGGNFSSIGTGVPGENYQIVGDPAVAPKLFRLFGDSDGNGAVTASDFNAFRLAYGQSGPSIFDFQSNDQVSASDFNEFRTRYGVTV